MELYQGARSKQDLKFIINEVSIFKILKTNDEIIKLATLMEKFYENIKKRYHI